MSDTFEYVDDKGAHHTTDSLDKVPKKYLKTMLVTGGDDEPPARSQAPAAGAFTLKGLPGGLPKGLDGLTPHLFAGAFALVLFYKFKGFLARIIIGVLLFVYFFTIGYPTVERLLRGDSKPSPRPSAQAPASKG